MTSRLSSIKLVLVSARRVLLVLAGVGALLLALFFVSQWYLLGAEEQQRETMRAERDALAATLARDFEALRASMREAASGEATVELLKQQDVNVAVVAASVKRRLPEALAVDAFRADLAEVYARDFAEFGYARANLLLEARNGRYLAQVLGGAGERRLALAVPVMAEGVAVGYVLAEFPFQVVSRPIREAYRRGYLVLRQGEGAASVLVEMGDTDLAADALGELVNVRHSSLRLGVAQGVQGVMFPHPVLSLILGAVLLLLAVLAFLAAAGRLQRRAAEAEGPELTVAEAAALAAEEARKVEAERAERRARSIEKRLPSEPAPAPVPVAGEALERSIFRAYDIRGVVGQTLTEGTARLIGQAVGTVVLERGLREVVVARDGRLSGPRLAAALISGLRKAGCDVVDIGAVPTPVLYFATFLLNTGSGVMVTGSHNPPEYNGFKIMVGGDTLAEDAIHDLYRRIAEGRLAQGHGGLQVLDVKQDYIDRITGDIQIERRLKVVVDCGNGIAGDTAPEVLEGIGCEVLPLYCDVDGTFPNHHPDPSDPENLRDLITTVQRLNADIGLAFDGDGDRLGVVTRLGEIVYADRLLMLFAHDVLTRNPGAVVIYDVKCTGHLAGEVLKYGGSPIMWKTGHSLIKAKMKETDAELAGEMSGHFFFRERWYGFDDGIYAAARLLEILAADPREPEEVLGELPKGVSTPELKVPMSEGEHHAFVEMFQKKAQFDGARVSHIDGVRADWPDGWGLVRASNTTPALVLRFDADSGEAMSRIQAAFRGELNRLGPDLVLPF
ncbi:MAG TPA: phosphomannomutase/phosphoglucomutase [Xanthomonadaceae bacterium]|nr:phosphomannomutase/phosphoglucomutase [Xanthomonadaceae bacterium]